jgi:hypothetical protein
VSGTERPTSSEWDADFLLDRDFRFVSTAKMRSVLTRAPAFGRSAWDVFGGEGHLRPSLERAFEAGEPTGFRVYYDSTLLEVLAEPSGRFLRVRYRVLRTVRIRTLDTLLEDMRFVAAELARPFGSPPLAEAPDAGTREPLRTP